MDLNQILSVLTIIAANLGTVLALYMNMDKKLDENRKETNNILRAIQEEMKEFHTKLAVQDAEYKAHMMFYHAPEGNKK